MMVGHVLENFSQSRTSAAYQALSDLYDSQVATLLECNASYVEVNSLSTSVNGTGVILEVTVRPVNGSSGGNVRSTKELQALVRNSAWWSPRVSSVIAHTAVGTCGNGVCELGERCGVSASDPCCPQDCPVPVSGAILWCGVVLLWCVVLLW
jgi:hypothetical protein